jgi:hypothetical protein
MNIWQRKVEELTVWKGFEPTSRTKEIYNKALAYIMQQCEKLDSELYNQFDGLQAIVWTKDRRDIPCENALGCAELGTKGSVYSIFFDDPNYDFFIMSMELVHRGMGEYYLENKYPEPFKKANDIPHFAANIMQEPYASWRTKKFKLLSDILTLKRPVKVPIFIYNTQYLLNHTDELVAKIKKGTAPTGANPYWSALPDSDAKSEIMDWLGHYRHEIDHHLPDGGH